MLKMGILEIADVYAVNKADLGGSAAFVEHLSDALSEPGAHGRDPARRAGEGVRELAKAIESHRQYLATGERGRALRAARAGRRILRALAERLAEEASCEGACRTELRRLAAAVAAGKMSEWGAAGELMRSTMSGSKNKAAGKSGRLARKRR
jgi:LAO/AO transport system kinase